MRVSLDSLRVQLEADPDFSDRQRAALLARARELLTPVIRANVEHLVTRLLPIQ